jgi:hypothetical protein
MAEYKIDLRHAVDQVTQATYQRERHARLRADDMCEESDYKMRVKLKQQAGKFAVDYLCKIKEIVEVGEIFGIVIVVVGENGEPVEAPEDLAAPLDENGLILEINQNQKAIPNTEGGYFISGINNGFFLMEEPAATEDEKELGNVEAHNLVTVS